MITPRKSCFHRTLELKLVCVAEDDGAEGQCSLRTGKVVFTGSFRPVMGRIRTIASFSAFTSVNALRFHLSRGWGTPCFNGRSWIHLLWGIAWGAERLQDTFCHFKTMATHCSLQCNISRAAHSRGTWLTWTPKRMPSRRFDNERHLQKHTH